MNCLLTTYYILNFKEFDVNLQVFTFFSLHEDTDFLFHRDELISILVDRGCFKKKNIILYTTESDKKLYYGWKSLPIVHDKKEWYWKQHFVVYWSVTYIIYNSYIKLDWIKLHQNCIPSRIIHSFYLKNISFTEAR